MADDAQTRRSDIASAMIAATSQLAPVVANRRSDFDVKGRLPDDVFAELASLGLFRLLMPSTLGGPGLSALEFMDVVEAAARLDGTIGWLVGNGGGMARIGGFLHASSATAIYDDPAAFVVSSTGAVGRAVRVQGGFRVTGRWPFGSGSPHGTWFAPVCAIETRSRHR